MAASSAFVLAQNSSKSGGSGSNGRSCSGSTPTPHRTGVLSFSNDETEQRTNPGCGKTALTLAGGMTVSRCKIDSPSMETTTFSFLGLFAVMMNSNGSLVWTRCDFRLHSTVTTNGFSAALTVALFTASEAVGATCPINMLPHMVMTAIGYFII